LIEIALNTLHLQSSNLAGPFAFPSTLAPKQV
jgi:hypothetical protein